MCQIPGAGVMGRCKSPDGDAGNQTCVFCKISAENLTPEPRLPFLPLFFYSLSMKWVVYHTTCSC